jgi:hypothetical protein
MKNPKIVITDNRAKWFKAEFMRRYGYWIDEQYYTEGSAEK